jgi:Protein of unknown function (DUF1579)
MRKLGLPFVLCAGLALLAGRYTLGQGPTKPGPEHERLKQLEGIWDANANFGGMEMKGTMTYKMDLGGLWLVGDFEGDMGGRKFRGKGLDSYDPNKKKYVGIWCDSMSCSPMVTEGTYDPEKKTTTMMGEGPGPDGKPARYKMTTEEKDKDTILFTMNMIDKDGKDQQMGMITYKRKG